VEPKKNLIEVIFGSFVGKDGFLSTSKLLSFFGFIFFIIASFIVLYTMPEKFNYELFAILTGGGAVSSRVIDKWLNIKANQR
jgi:hypothetical protein